MQPSQEQVNRILEGAINMIQAVGLNDKEAILAARVMVFTMEEIMSGKNREDVKHAAMELIQQELA